MLLLLVVCVVVVVFCFFFFLFVVGVCVCVFCICVCIIYIICVSNCVGRLCRPHKVCVGHEGCVCVCVGKVFIVVYRARLMWCHCSLCVLLCVRVVHNCPSYVTRFAG